MNKKSIGIKRKVLVIASSVLISSSVCAETLQVSWLDSSSNEDGFMIEKRLLENELFETISTLSANTSTYTDSDVIIDETYCYRIVAYNQAGFSPSEESCLAVIGEDEVEVITPRTPGKVSTEEYTYTDITISHEFISKPTTIELGDKKLYSFKSDETYNESYSDSNIENAEFYAESGSVKEYDRDYFIFQKNGDELVNGYVHMGFNSNNKLTFDLQSIGSMQTATLYMQAGVWSNESSSVVVTVGDKEQNISLPRGYAWQYISVEIMLDGTAPVMITTDTDQGGYSSLMFAGIVLNDPILLENEENEEPIQYASLLSVDTGISTSVDVTDIEFVTHSIQTGNVDFSDASVIDLSFYGDSKTYSNNYNFINQNGSSYAGYKFMQWNEENGIMLKLQSGDSQINIASLYFSAGAWTSQTAIIEVIINDQSEFIELSSGYAWKRMKVDIEFEGELNVDIRPVGTLGGYSALQFAGLTLY